MAGRAWRFSTNTRKTIIGIQQEAFIIFKEVSVDISDIWNT